MKKINLGIIFGGRSGEHEVSLNSARTVIAALDKDKYDIQEIGITHSGNWLSGENALEGFISGNTEKLSAVTLLPDPTRSGLYFIEAKQGEATIKSWQPIDIFFPVLHGTYGEDGTIQGLFEMANVAYVGAGVLGSAVGMDKGVFKAVMQAHSIPVVPGVLFSRNEIHADIENVVNQIEASLSYPMFVKPANMGSSVGVSKCNYRADLLEGLLEATRYDRRVLVELGINAREIEISVRGNSYPEASTPGEIIPATEFYSYDAKYHDDRSEAIIPAAIAIEKSAAMRKTAIEAYLAIDCAGLARVDFLLDKDSGDYYLNELNTLPGFTNISMYPKLWEKSGVSIPALVDRLVEFAFERRADRDNTEWRYER